MTQPSIALETIGLTKTFHTTQPPTRVLDGIDFQVHAGEFVAIMGASGSGKSTLLYAMSGMDRPSGGRVLLEGHDLTELSDDKMSRVRLTRMGFVFQQAHFLANLSIRDNIALPALKARPGQTEQSLARVEALLHRFEIAHVAHHGITEVSGGQLQRASICRALAAEPAVVFADEPTGALNASMTEEVMDVLSEVHADQTTMVMVTHDPGCAARADRIVYLRDGALVAERAWGGWQRAEANQRHDEVLEWLRGWGF
ncbi:MAG: ABC transporter ATP-binding protein [Arachnia sp.]